MDSLFKRICKTAGMFLLAVLFFSCGQNDSGIWFQLPDFIAENEVPALKGWNVTVFDGDEEHRFEIPAASREFFVSFLSKNDSGPSSVKAFPVTDYEDFILPAGTVFPFSTELTWNGGFEAELLEKLYKGCSSSDSENLSEKNFAARFNWTKLHSSIEKKAEDSSRPYNPWLLDTEKILSAIYSGTFTASDLTAENCTSVSVEKVQAILGTEDFLLIPDFKAFTVTDTVLLKTGVTQKFLFISGENTSLMTALLDSDRELSLELNKIPI